MYALDSYICIDFLRGRLPGVQEMVAKSDPELFAVPAVCEAELLLGAAKSAAPATERHKVEQFLAPFRILPFDSACARTYAMLRAHLEEAGTPIGPLDNLIAATALANQATLVTNNGREFSRVPGLNVEAWEEIDW